MWTEWKRGFDKWEDATAKYLEATLRSPLMLGPAGGFLTLVLKGRAHLEDAKHWFWGELGLATKRDQERALHLLHKLESRMVDLEERLQGAPPGAN